MDYVSAVKEAMALSIPSSFRPTTEISCRMRSMVAPCAGSAILLVTQGFRKEQLPEWLTRLFAHRPTAGHLKFPGIGRGRRSTDPRCGRRRRAVGRCTKRKKGGMCRLSSCDQILAKIREHPLGLQ
ncbi:hypothetical protein NDU88_005846 [Pleurodeles waltl]|uniref:Uncharacterized protein n=1 Tax=Pleurodeles waltl TaxID=8319 RepID=A0AAV7MI54_PLEWA|nr:hypothetical protein NDU88_005846 [Pleurodeles waltl]